jgi:Tol biopolymer transport system component
MEMRKTVLLLASLTAALMLSSVVALVVPEEQARSAFPGINARIAFVSDRSGSNEIYTIWFNGNNLTRLTHDSGPDTAPSWSADGK